MLTFETKGSTKPLKIILLLNKLNDKLKEKLDSKNKMTQLGLNVFGIFNFFFCIFENRKIICEKINDIKKNDKKIKIEISNLNWLVKFRHVVINELCTQYYDWSDVS